MSASMKPMPGISHPDSRAADRENFSPRPRPPVATAGRTHSRPGRRAAGPVVAVSQPPGLLGRWRSLRCRVLRRVFGDGGGSGVLGVGAGDDGDAEGDFGGDGDVGQQ